MIAKKLFIECMDALKNYSDYEHKLSELNVNIFERDEVSDLIVAFLKLLSYTCHDVQDDKRFPNDIEYFVYDCDFGRKSDEYPIEYDDGTIVHLTDVNTLWDYLVEWHPEIVDTEEDEKD